MSNRISRALSASLTVRPLDFRRSSCWSIVVADFAIYKFEVCEITNNLRDGETKYQRRCRKSATCNALGIEAFRSRPQARFTIARRRWRNAIKIRPDDMSCLNPVQNGMTSHHIDRIGNFPLRNLHQVRLSDGNASGKPFRAKYKFA